MSCNSCNTLTINKFILKALKSVEASDSFTASMWHKERNSNVVSSFNFQFSFSFISTVFSKTILIRQRTVT